MIWLPAFTQTKLINSLTKSTAMQELIDKLNEAAARIFVSKNTLAYKTALEAINNPGSPTVCGTHTGSGRFTSSKSWQSRVAMLLGNAGIPYTTSNVAPKGGAAGDRITVFLPKPTTNFPGLLTVDTRVGYSDNYGDRIGTIVEVNLLAERARVKWDGRKLRTWIRISALKIITQ